MSNEGKVAKQPANSRRILTAVNVVAGLRAERPAIEHCVEHAHDVAEARAKAAAANAKVGMAERTRELDKRLDDARAGMHDRR